MDEQRFDALRKLLTDRIADLERKQAGLIAGLDARLTALARPEAFVCPRAGLWEYTADGNWRFLGENPPVDKPQR